MKSLALRLREETRDLHTIAERSGIMRPLLRGSLEPKGYAALLRNLHPIYVALEEGLQARRADPMLRAFSHPALARRDRLESDLRAIVGPEWATLPVMPITAEYANRLASGTALVLLAHAYVRYLGDLSGGQYIARIVRRVLGAELESAVAFYDFDVLGDLGEFKDQVRSELDGLAMSDDVADAVVAEARWGFDAHALMFNELESTRGVVVPSATGVDPTA